MERVKPGKPALRMLGVLLLVLSGLAVVAMVGFGILTARNAYFEQRNLRELDRIAAEMDSTATSLAQAATLHFVPQQLHFSLSQQVECLMATTEIMGARRQPMQISYYFVDTESTRRIAEWYAAQTPHTLPADSATPPQVTSRELPRDLCGYQRPLGRSTNDGGMFLENGRLRLERTARLQSMLWPMSTERRPDPTELSSCVQRERDIPEGAAPTDLRSFISRCFAAAAMEDMGDQTYSYRPAADIPDIVNQSISAALRSNTIRINVATPAEALDFDTALEVFDAVQVIGSDPGNQDAPRLLYQAGRVPAAVEGEADIQAQMMTAISGATGQPAAPAAKGREPDTRRGSDFFGDSRIIRTADLILFERTFRSLAGLHCRPCRIVGIVERSRFNDNVRRIDGVHATIFLIGLLSLLGLVPLLHLQLRKRLDASGRTSQFLTWFSLTLLSASAAIAGLSAWASLSSRNAGAAYAGEAIERISAEFDAELRASLRTVGEIGARLRESPRTFPAPQTLPTRLQFAVDWTRQRPRTEQELAVRTLATAWHRRPQAAIVDTVAYYRRDGFIDRDRFRLVASRFPAFGINLSDRAYFTRAKNRDFDTVTLERCPGEDRTNFILDRVLSRPDGAPRVVFVTPTERTCTEAPVLGRTATINAARPTGAKPEAQGAETEAAPNYTDDMQLFYDPTGREFLVATGTLRTFLGRALGPGFRYAVVDPDRPRDEPNVLFHSDPRSELVERFEREIDDPDYFAAIARQALVHHDEAGDEPDAHAHSGLRLDTNYHAQAARLTVARLHPQMDWLLVIIEDRNDASFAVWRAATFGYGVWVLGAIVWALVLLAYSALRPAAMDRNPSQFLWPARRLEEFTPPRLERHARMKDEIVEAARWRDRHFWWTLVAGLVAIPAAEGASRATLAFAAALAAFAARSYFRGLTAGERDQAMQMDRWIIRGAWFWLFLTILLFSWGIAADVSLRAYSEPDRGIETMVATRWIAVLVGCGLIAACLYVARSHLEQTVVPPDAKTGRLRRWLIRPRRPKLDIGWMAALFVIGGLPAAAGFLDSYDQDRSLHLERHAQVAERAAEQRTEAVNAINIARLLKLPDRLVADIISPPDAGPAGLGHPKTEQCLTLSCFAIFYLDLHEDALDFSDSVPFHMLDAFRTRSATHWAMMPFALLLPLLALGLVLTHFRRHYFSRPPLLSPGKDPEFDPPLSMTRSEFIAQGLLKAANGEEPGLMFRPAGGRHHLILGVGFDLCDEWAAGRQLAHMPGILWVDLLEPDEERPSEPEPETPADRPASAKKTGAKASAQAEPVEPVEPVEEAPIGAVVIGNLDLALQVPDNGQSADRAFRTIRRIVEEGGERQIFLLADIDPLDRISLLWEQQSEATTPTKAWRWAELIEDFTLFPIRHEASLVPDTGEPAVLRTISEELGVLDVGFAHQLRDRLLHQLRERRRGDEPRDEERIVSFISEQMSDYYQKIWASSSDEERVILYRIARNCHLKMPESRAIRSLLARGLLIRVPEYRLINRSFTRYVCRIGESTQLQRAADIVGGLDHVWPMIRYPVAALAAGLVVLLQLLAPSAPGGAIGLLPAVLALVPAALGRWFQDRAGAG